MHRDTDFVNPPPCRIGALAIICDVSGAVLMVQKSYKGGSFGLPGGAAHEGEYPHVAAAREVSEEIGVLFTPGRLLVVDVVPKTPEGAMGVNFVFNGGILPSGTEIVLPVPGPCGERELISHRFVSLGEIGDVASELTYRRIRAALSALDGGYQEYLTEGYPVPRGVRR